MLKAETTQPPAGHPSLQAARTTRWLRHYNGERPHEALQQQPPAQHYHDSRRRYRGIRAPRYPKNLPVRRVHNSGEIKWLGRFRFAGEAFAGHRVALKRKRPGVWASSSTTSSWASCQLHAADTSGLRTATRGRPVKGPRNV